MVSIDHGDKICLHLLQYCKTYDRDCGDSFPIQTTQDGIAEALGMGSERRSSLVYQFKKLKRERLLDSMTHRVLGKPRKVTVYFLTGEGIASTRNLERKMLDTEIHFLLDGSEEKISVRDFLKEREEATGKIVTIADLLMFRNIRDTEHLKTLPVDVGIETSRVSTHSIESFLREIEASFVAKSRIDNPLYNLKRLFEKPAVFGDIHKKLSKENLAIVLGEKNAGKKYTGLNLLYDFSQMGFTPKAVKGRELRNKWGIEYIVAEFFPRKSIVMVMDPFGCYDFESNSTFLNLMERILFELRFRNLKLLVTSKEDFFSTGMEELRKRGIREKLSKNTVTMNLKDERGERLYSESTMKRIIFNHARLVRPAWFVEKPIEGLEVRLTDESNAMLTEMSKLLVSPSNVLRLMHETCRLKDRKSVIDIVKKSHQ